MVYRPDLVGPEVLLGTVARLHTRFYITGPGFVHAEAQARQVLRSGYADHCAIDKMNAGQVPAACLHRADSQAQALDLLWALFSTHYGHLLPQPGQDASLTVPVLMEVR